VLAPNARGILAAALLQALHLELIRVEDEHGGLALAEEGVLLQPRMALGPLLLPLLR